MLIDETLVKELLDRPADDAALVLLEGTAQVADRAALEGDSHFRGAAVLLTRGELVERLGGSSPAEEDLTRVAASLSDSVGKLGG
ncbi:MULTISPECIES: hypothetical protein [Streptomyces]|uniref:Uncharacterized protein n=1 Tax=Streptomyces chilikensis TaxID=1194079 RepID=A0ABV3ES39_9ACTN|nr:MULTISPECIES: hypothetical protein [Streptomyces]MDH6223311.1 hypothetical protein [Streptomyces sp. MJP52]